MNFLHGADFYWLLILIPGALILLTMAGARRRRLLRLVLGTRAEDPDAVGLSRGRRAVRFVLLLLAAVLLLTAAARPWWGTRPVPYSATGRDVLVLFDVSKSMLATDVAPSRLKHAQYLLKELVNANRGDRFGLVAFAGTSFLECPLTTDRTSFMQYVDELSPESIPVGGTNIERALRTAEEAFQAAEGNFRAILLITDGDELSGESRRAVEGLRAKHIPLFILGLGDPDVPALVPEPDGSFKRDAQGELVKTRLAENALRELALSTGGVYVRSTALDSGLGEIERRIQALVPANVGSGVRSVPIERFPYFLIAAAVLLLGYFLLNDRRSVAVLILLGLTVFPALGEPLPPNEKQKAAEDSPAVPDEAAEPETADPVQLYNQALTWQQEGREEASSLYEKAIRKAGENTAVGARSFFNLGVGRHRGARELLGKARQTLQSQQLDAAARELENARQELDGASELYAQALTLPDAARNAVNPGANLQKLNEDREMVETLLKKIEELKKQQQQAQQQTRQAREQNQQDQQKQGQQDQQNQQNQQDQQGQQDQQNQQGQQDQQNQQGQQDQQNQQGQQNQAGSAAEQMEQARQATEELQRQAEDLQQQQLSEAARRAAEDLRKAEDATQRNRPEEADRHLQNALKNLGSDSNQDRQNDQQQAGEQDRQQSGQDQKAGEQEQEQQERDKEGGQEQDKGNEPLPEPGKSGGEPRRGEPGKLDKESAEKMLEIMADQEKDLREAIKRNSGAGRIRVEKDW